MQLPLQHQPILREGLGTPIDLKRQNSAASSNISLNTIPVSNQSGCDIIINPSLDTIVNGDAQVVTDNSTGVYSPTTGRFYYWTTPGIVNVPSVCVLTTCNPLNITMRCQVPGGGGIQNFIAQ